MPRAHERTSAEAPSFGAGSDPVGVSVTSAALAAPASPAAGSFSAGVSLTAAFFSLALASFFLRSELLERLLDDVASADAGAAPFDFGDLRPFSDPLSELPPFFFGVVSPLFDRAEPSSSFMARPCEPPFLDDPADVDRGVLPVDPWEGGICGVE
jgi:hypothetical protein